MASPLSVALTPPLGPSGRLAIAYPHSKMSWREAIRRNARPRVCASELSKFFDVAVGSVALQRRICNTSQSSQSNIQTWCTPRRF